MLESRIEIKMACNAILTQRYEDGFLGKLLSVLMYSWINNEHKFVTVYRKRRIILSK